MTRISLHRPLTSYAKVQALIGAVIRNRKFQLQRPRVRAAKYLDIGCGPNTHENFINLDYLWRPGVDVCWDLRRTLPFPDGTLHGVFSEHCLEHFPLPVVIGLLTEIRRLLVPRGVARIVVPDGELYLRTYVRQLDGDTSLAFPFQGQEGFACPWSPILSVNRIFYQDRESLFGHRLIYDFALLAALLRHCGFTDIEKRSYRAGSDPTLLIDSPHRQIESLYVEARSSHPA